MRRTMLLLFVLALACGHGASAAGTTKAIGQLAQANQNGQVGLRFTGLEMPDGSTESIEGSGVSLDYGPLKGVVNGRNGAKRALVRSMTGIGTVAASLVSRMR